MNEVSSIVDVTLVSNLLLVEGEACQRPVVLSIPPFYQKLLPLVTVRP
jgi:hypothetical protein